jgi:TIGR03009 family protein
MKVTLGGFLASATLIAQAPTSPVTPAAVVPEAPKPQPNQLDPNLVKHLLAWEKSMKEVTNYSVETTCTSTNLITKREDKKVGTVWVMKPNLTRYNMSRQPAPGEKPGAAAFEAAICDGKNIYLYDSSDKTVTMVKLGQGSVLMLDLLKGMTAQEMVNRFDMKLTKEDANYVYLEVKPRLKDDMSEFEMMTLVLCGPQLQGRAYVPRMVITRKQNGQQQDAWDFPDPKVNPQGMKAEHFQYQKPPEGWRVQQAVTPATQTTTGNTKVITPGGNK